MPPPKAKPRAGLAAVVRGAAEEERRVGARLRGTRQQHAESQERESGPHAYPDDTIAGGMDFRLTDEQELLRRSVREFAEAELRPHVREWDEAQHFPREVLAQCASLGLMGIQFPDAYGGAAMSSVDYCICIEELARVDPAVCLSIAAHNGLGAAHIFMFGTEEQKQRYLRAAGRAASSWRRGGSPRPRRAATRRPCARPPSATATTG